MRLLFGFVAAFVATFGSPFFAQPQSAAIRLWNEGRVAFGVFVPEKEPDRQAAYVNPLYDFLFLNLEGKYDASVLQAVARGRRGASPPKTLIVRIPPFERDGEDAVKARIREAFAAGADGVAVPHIRSVDEARLALSYFRSAGVNLWTPADRGGEALAMLMLEDPGVTPRAAEIASLGGYSILACGIGSLTRALGGNRDAAEAANQRILAETKRTKLVNLLTATEGDVERRVKEGFLGLIPIGPDPDRTIRIGRAAAGRGPA